LARPNAKDIAMSFVATPAVAWVMLAVAGALEVVWVIGMKYAEGFTRFTPSVVTVVAAIGSFWLLALAIRVLPVGTAYAAWTGIGAVGAALLGMLLFKEPATAARIACIALIVAGIVGLKLAGGAGEG
jgi:quaternary ammonium compound-resistance protein SugE